MSRNSWRECLIAAQLDGSALTNTTTATSILPGHAKITMPAGLIDGAGKAFRISAFGRISTVVTTPGTLTLDFKLGSTVVASSGALALNTTAQTNVNWDLEMMVTARAVGTTGNFMLGGTWSSHAVIGSAAPTAGTAGTHMLPFNAAPVVGNNFDTTAAQIVDLFGTWSIANAANSITCHQFTIELLN